MVLVKSFDEITDWFNKNVCSKIKLKRPNDNNNSDYSPEFINPFAFPLYVPGKERLPPDTAAPVPSICIQLLEGNDDLLKRKRQLKLRLCLASWNPGEHGGDIFYPRKNPNEFGGYSYYKSDCPEALERYRRHCEGWRDIWNFTDLTLREIEGAEYIAGWRLVKEIGLNYGHFAEDGVIWDYYPYWHTWITLTIESGSPNKVPEQYKDLL